MSYTVVEHSRCDCLSTDDHRWIIGTSLFVLIDGEMDSQQEKASQATSKGRGGNRNPFGKRGTVRSPKSRLLSPLRLTEMKTLLKHVRVNGDAALGASILKLADPDDLVSPPRYSKIRIVEEKEGKSDVPGRHIAMFDAARRIVHETGSVSSRTRSSVAPPDEKKKSKGGAATVAEELHSGSTRSTGKRILRSTA